MRAWHEGSVQKVGRKWRGRVMIGGVRHVGPVVERRADALPALWRKLERELGAAAGEESPTLWTCALRKAERPISESWSPTTRDLWKALLARLRGTALAGMAVDEATDADVQSWLDAQPGSPRTRRNYLELVRQLLRENGVECRVKPPEVRERRHNLLSPDEQRRLLELPMSREQRLIVLLGLRCGLRRSEMAGLRHEDRDGPGILVRRAVVKAAGVVAIKAPKTRSSESWVPLPPELEQEIGRGTGWVLGDGGPNPPSPARIARLWRALVDGTEFERVGLHDLRRSYGMTLLERGVDLRTAGEMMRHDPALLARLYARSRRDLKIEAAKRLAE